MSTSRKAIPKGSRREEIIARHREAEVLLSQGKKVAEVIKGST